VSIGINRFIEMSGAELNTSLFSSSYLLFQKLLLSLSPNTNVQTPPIRSSLLFPGKCKLVDEPSVPSEPVVIGPSSILPLPNLQLSRNNPFLLFFNQYHISPTEILLVLCDVWRDMEILNDQQDEGQKQTGLENPGLNPELKAELNPELNSELNPELNPRLNPELKADPAWSSKLEAFSGGGSSLIIPLPKNLTRKELLQRTLAFLHTLFYTLTVFLSKKYPIFILNAGEAKKTEIDGDLKKIKEKDVKKVDGEKENREKVENKDAPAEPERKTSSGAKRKRNASAMPLLPMPFVMLYLFYIGILSHFNRYRELTFALKNNVIPAHPEILHQLLVLCTRRLNPKINNSNNSDTISVLPPYCHSVLPYAQQMSLVLSFYYPDGWEVSKVKPFLGSTTLGLPVVAYLLSGVLGVGGALPVVILVDM
jgi:hypothetical protein